MIDKLVNFIRPTQSTIYDTESLTTLESIGKVIEKVNKCIENFNNLEIKTTNDYNNFLNQITTYKNEVIEIINDIKNDNNSFKNEFREIIKSLESFNVTLEIINKQSKYIQDLAKINQDNIDKGTIATKNEINKINMSLEQKANISDIGSPLVANSIAEMTDTSKVYVNTTDGNWYSYNGSQWVSGGVYNATAIGDYSIEKIKLNDSVTTLFEDKLYSIKTDFDLDNSNAVSNKTIFINKIIPKNTTIERVRFYVTSASQNSGAITIALYKKENNTLSYIETIGSFNARTPNTLYTFRINKTTKEEGIIGVYAENTGLAFVQGDYGGMLGYTGEFTLSDNKLPSTVDITSTTWSANTFFKLEIRYSMNKIYALDKRVNTLEKSLNINNNIITVGAKGCNYTSIQDAINSIEDDTETNRYVILVSPGVYKRFYSYSLLDGTTRGRGVARYISIIGQDKYSCIVKDKISSTFESNGVLKNLHIITTNEPVPSDTTDYYDSLSGYGLHIDQAGYSECVVEDCIIESYKHAAIGSGSKSNQTIKLIRNKLITHKEGESGLFYHNNHWQVSGNKNQKLWLEDNYCYADNGYGIYLNDTLVGQSQYPSLVNVTMIRNIVGSGDKGFNDNAIRKQDITGDYISGTNFKLDYGFGNNASILNK